jgi:hypothetical protein
MRNKLLATLSAIAIAAVTVQAASAAERQKIRKPAQSSATATEQFRNSNAAWTAPASQAYPGVYPYSGGWSAPAGH